MSRRPLVVAASLLALHAHAQPTISIRESLGRSLTNQWIHVPLSGAAHERPRAGCLELDGGEGKRHGQLVLDGAGADVYVRADIEALSSKTYAVRSAPSVACASDLRIDARGHDAEIRTERFGIRVPVGAGSGADMPPPIVAMQTSSGDWNLNGMWFGSGRPKRWSARLVINGPLLARWEGEWTYADGIRSTVRIDVASGDSRASIRTETTGNAADRGWAIDISRIPDPRLMLASEWDPKGWGERAGHKPGRFEAVPVILAHQPAGLITSLVPWQDWWDARTQTSWTFVSPNGEPLLAMQSRDAASWIEPREPGAVVAWGSPEQRVRWVPLVREPNGGLQIRFNASAGKRCFLMGSGRPALGRDYQREQRMILAWKVDPAISHPRLFLSRKQWLEDRSSGRFSEVPVEQLIARSLKSSYRYEAGGANALGPALRAFVATGDREVAEKGRLKEMAEDLGDAVLADDFDAMRSTSLLTNLYDAIADENILSAADERRFRSRIAWLGYRLASPETWSPERGFATGNPDMHVTMAVDLALVAAVLPDHPMSRVWWDLAMKRIGGWMSRELGPGGEWPENSHYTAVSMSALVPLVLASARRGSKNIGCDGPLVRIMLNLARQYAPPDPRYSSERTLVGYGKGTAGERFALPGALAVATAHCDAGMSRRFQWLWEQSGRSLRFANRMLVGFEDVVIDPRLPAEAPAGSSSLTDDFLVSRSRFGDARENFGFFLDSPSGSISPWESGALIAYYAFGKPISLLFGGGEYSPWTREVRLQSRVLAARDWKASTVIHDRLEVRRHGGSVLSGGDYGLFEADVVGAVTAGNGALTPADPWPRAEHAANGPLHWRRQLLFVKPLDEEGSHYLVFRDTVSGAQPSEWTLWLLSNGISPVKPSNPARGADELPMSDTYTASGAYGVDVDLYVASPTQSPRQTMRWGFRQQAGFNGVREGLGETQDLFHLKLDGDGAYYVVAFPRPARSERPEFSRLAAGRVLRIARADGTDWIFLGDAAERAEAGEVGFATAAGWVRQDSQGVVLGVSDGGWVRHANVTFESGIPAQLTIPYNGRCIAEFGARHPDGAISVRIAGREVLHRHVPATLRSISLDLPRT